MYAVTKEQFIKLNGHSNVFFGWGGEDDNFYDRVLFKYNYFGKLPNKIGRYHTPYSNHTRDKENKKFLILNIIFTKNNFFFFLNVLFTLSQVLKWYFRKRFRFTLGACLKKRD